MSAAKRATSPRRVCVVTGTRAEFGLLRSVMDAIKQQRGLELHVVAAGAHFLRPAQTIHEVEVEHDVAARVPMQVDGATGRLADAAALGRGVEGFAMAFGDLKPDWVVVLGDRIEALAAASAASVGGIAVCHVHGGDRAEGVADEAMRHAITKLSHLHCAATEKSAKRILRMGEPPERVHVTGSPAIDGLRAIKPMNDEDAAKLGDPRVVMLLHGVGGVEGQLRLSSNWKRILGRPRPELIDDGRFATLTYMATLALPDEPPLGACQNVGLTSVGGETLGGVGPRGLFLMPNHDPGREEIIAAWAKVAQVWHWPMIDHLPRERFVALLKRMAQRGRGVVVGNSSAGLIECAALGVPALNVGPRQNGRERDRNVVDADPLDTVEVVAKMRRADRLAGKLERSTRFGDGRAGSRIAGLLARVSVREPQFLRKCNTY